MADEQQENGETKPISEGEYIELLKERGKENIVLPLTASESQIAVQSTQFRYNMDYFVDDYVTVEHRRFGLRQDKIQIIGMIESFDQNGRNLTPTFADFSTQKGLTGLIRRRTSQSICRASSVMDFSTPTVKISV